MPVFLQKAIALCEKIESGEIDFSAVPYIDPQTDYIVSNHMDKGDFEWNDCTVNNQPGWMAYRSEYAPCSSLFLKCKRSKNAYFLSD